MTAASRAKKKAGGGKAPASKKRAPVAHGEPRIEMMSVRELAAWPGNPREHDVPALRASMRRFGAVEPPVLDERSGRLVVGHGRSLKALAGMEADGEEPPRYVRVVRGIWYLPVVRGIAFESEREAEAYLLASNRLADKGSYDDVALAEMLARHSENLDGIGWDRDGYEELLEALKNGPEQPAQTGIYSKKIVVPTYEPRGEKPAVGELVDRGKVDELLEEIDGADLPDDVARFLRFAAERHAVFNFRRIAEFYCHADERTQGLFERSALVLIDFDQAVENGFVKLTERLSAIVDVEGWNGDAE